MESDHFLRNVMYRIQGINGACPRAWLYLTGIGLGSFVLAYNAARGEQEARNEIAFRKVQLSKDVVEVKGENFPWNKDNLHEWLYRPIRITGRPIHAKTMFVHRKSNLYDGYDYVVPVVTRENADGSEQYGILMNKGWIPHEYKEPSARERIENVMPQTFTCYLSTLSELDEKNSFFKTGNSPSQGRNRWGHVYLPDMAKATGFKNEAQTKLAVLEHVNLETPLDERNVRHWNISLNQQEDYPYARTRAGALQLATMPWEYEASRRTWTNFGLVSTGLGLALKFLV